eukprot:scaffold287712_cov79-Cyclotella_meneghiniana.AAC.2
MLRAPKFVSSGHAARTTLTPHPSHTKTTNDQPNDDRIIPWRSQQHHKYQSMENTNILKNLSSAGGSVGYVDSAAIGLTATAREWVFTFHLQMEGLLP